MSLRDDLFAAVAAAGGPKNRTFRPDGTWATVAPLDGGDLLPVQVRLSGSGAAFSFVAPLAIIKRPEDEVLLSLLRRHADADRTDGVAYAVLTEEDVDLVAAVHHWVLPGITPEQFTALLVTFSSAVRTLRSDLADMIEGGAPLELVAAASLAELTGEPG